ncbi:hypothetical protein GALMADRAFT_1157171 [Galerina marginata CBS 339.88]|uniref:Uncharacterized protein n=1 Tax=Galerina marginata (strain CBS 339.88) TaxID=685588 RepID=A0A067S8T0_GALM3|nr:hypothetical protein GALMADRAFT_1157171 [Galerina marginata CBS 339.88]
MMQRNGQLAGRRSGSGDGCDRWGAAGPRISHDMIVVVPVGRGLTRVGIGGGKESSSSRETRAGTYWAGLPLQGPPLVFLIPLWLPESAPSSSTSDGVGFRPLASLHAFRRGEAHDGSILGLAASWPVVSPGSRIRCWPNWGEMWKGGGRKYEMSSNFEHDHR